MKRSFLLISSLAVFFSCKDDNDTNALQAELAGTTWSVTKLEVESILGTGLSYEPDPDTDCHQKLSFRDGKRVVLYDDCGAKGCGEWTTTGDGSIKLVIPYEQVVPNLCEKSNFTSIFSAEGKADVNGETLVIEGLGGAFDQFQYLGEEWADLIEQFQNGELTLKTYFTKATDDLDEEPSCCGELEWNE